MSKSSDPPVKPAQKVARIGKYEVLKPIGAGGMGVVVKARDPVLNREVALKVISVGDAAGDLAMRLLQEAHVIAKLEHPGIVPVHHPRDFDEHAWVDTRPLEAALARLRAEQQSAAA